MLVCISFNTSFRWVNIYVCGCYFEVAIQIKQKRLNWNEIPLFVGNNLAEEKTFICFYKKKVINCCRKKLLSSRKNIMWQMKFYGNADRDCLMEMGSNLLCSRFFEENEDENDEAIFDDFCRISLTHVLKAVSYLLYVLFLVEKCN